MTLLEKAAKAVNLLLDIDTQPKKGTVLEQVLKKAERPAKQKKPAKKKASKTPSKASVKKKTTKVSSGKKKVETNAKPNPKN